MIATRGHEKRPAFSLIELLLVMAIIGILVALVAAAAFKLSATVPKHNTELLLQKLAASLQQQFQAVIDQARQEPITNPTIVTVLKAREPAEARNYYISFRLIQEFPDSFDKANGKGAMLPAKPSYTELLKGKTPPTQTTAGNDFQSSICLWMILSEARGGSNFEISSLSPRELRDATGGSTNLKYIADHWGEPIHFYFIPATNLASQSNASGDFSSFLLVSAGPKKVKLPIDYPHLKNDGLSTSALRSDQSLIGR